MLDPLVIETCSSTHESLHVQQREVPDHLVVAEILGTAFGPVQTGVLADSGFLSDRSPAEIEGQSPAPIESDEVVIGTGGGDIRENRNQMRGSLFGRLPLNQAQIGLALHANLAIGPGLFGRPFDSVVTILGLVTKGVPLALRFVSPSDILNHENIAPSGKIGRLRPSFHTVGGAGHQDRVATFSQREIDVCIENSPISHGDGDAVLEADVIAGWIGNRETGSRTQGGRGKPQAGAKNRQDNKESGLKCFRSLP